MFRNFKFILGAIAMMFVGVFVRNAAADAANSILPSDTARAASPEILAGQMAPDFTLLNQDHKNITLSQYRGKWVVLYFYPKDFTGGCTLEAHNFQRDLNLYDSANAVILGVSLDSAGSHKDFCSKEGLNFKLLADTGGAVSTLYGSLHNWYGRKLSARNTFLIEPDGAVAKTFIGVKPGTHSAEVLAALKELQK